MFGDNLSMISDTTIAATRSLNVAMKDKFLVNFKMVLPAAIIVVLIYLFLGKSGSPTIVKTSFTWKHILLVVPYILVLVSALLGVNVIALLFLGVLFSSVLGIAMGSFDLWGALNACGKGTLGMAETLIVAILAGGFLNLIRWNGGIEYLLVKINNFIKGKSGCEVGVFLLVSVVNLFTANNTVAIVIAGPIAKDLSDRFQCENRRIASILDTASCFIQGLIPYGAQILIAVGVAKTAGLVVSTPSLLATQYYQYFMMLAVVFSFILRHKK
jgi:Na+/H+ antiporter NhaC